MNTQKQATPEHPIHELLAKRWSPYAFAERTVSDDDLRSLFEAARYSLDCRVSLDGMSAAENDPVRGRGTFDQIVRGIRHLGAAGLVPVVTVVEHAEGMAATAKRLEFFDFLRGLGLPRPRVKFLPLLRIGREVRRSHGYTEEERVRAGTLDAAA